MWQIVTSLEKKEQGVMVHLVAFDDDKTASRAVSKIKCSDLHADDGMDKLLAALDEVYMLLIKMMKAMLITRNL